MKRDVIGSREATKKLFPSLYLSCSVNIPTDDEETRQSSVYSNVLYSQTANSREHVRSSKQRPSSVSTVSQQSNGTQIKAKQMNESDEVISNFSLLRSSTREGRPCVNHSYRDHYHDPRSDEPGQGSFENNTTGNVAYSKSSLEQRPSTMATSITVPQPTQRHSRGGVTVAFPEKLHEMLRTVVSEGMDHVVSWQPHGRCFVIRRKEFFVEHVMPRYVFSNLHSG